MHYLVRPWEGTNRAGAPAHNSPCAAPAFPYAPHVHWYASGRGVSWFNCIFSLVKIKIPSPAAPSFLFGAPRVIWHPPGEWVLHLGDWLGALRSRSRCQWRKGLFLHDRWDTAKAVEVELKEKLPWQPGRLVCDLVGVAEAGSWGEAVPPDHSTGSMTQLWANHPLESVIGGETYDQERLGSHCYLANSIDSSKLFFITPTVEAREPKILAFSATWHDSGQGYMSRFLLGPSGKTFAFLGNTENHIISATPLLLPTFSSGVMAGVTVASLFPDNTEGEVKQLAQMLTPTGWAPDQTPAITCAYVTRMLFGINSVCLILVFVFLLWIFCRML